MRNRLRIAISVLCVIIFAVISWTMLSGREPVYEGKRLGQYLDQLEKAYPASVNGTKEIKAVYSMGPEAIPYLRRALRKRDSASVKGLVLLHKWLPKKLGDRLPTPPTPDYLSRYAVGAAACLAAFGPIARSAVPDLLDRFDDVRSINLAYYAVSEIGPKPEDLPQLVLLANSTNWGAPLYAVELIGKIGVASPAVLNTLTNLAANGESHIRTRAIGALANLGPNAAAAIPILTRNLDDPDAAVRVNSAVALSCAQDKANVPTAFILKELEDELTHGTAPSAVKNVMGQHEQNLLMMMRLLQSSGSEAQSALPFLRKILAEKSILVRLVATEALWKINRETNGLESLCVAGLAYFDPNIQMRSADLLARVCIEQHTVLPTLNEMMASKQEAVQFYAARALWNINGETDNTIPIIISGLQDHTVIYKNAEIRRLAAETLGEMGPKAHQATPSLIIALKDGEAKVAAAAADALKKIDPTASR